MAYDVGGIGGTSVLDLPVRRALEQARWPWQWGPPYTFPGNPPIAQELAETYRYQPEAMDIMRSIPVQMERNLGNSRGLYWPKDNRIQLREPFNPSTGAHEYAHAVSYNSPLPYHLSPGWWPSLRETSKLVPPSYPAWQRPSESFAFAAQDYAPLVNPIEYIPGRTWSPSDEVSPTVRRGLSMLYDFPEYTAPPPTERVKEAVSQPKWNLFDLVRAARGR